MDKAMKSLRVLTEMSSLVSPGVYGIFDDTQKKVFISCSNNVLKGISSVVTLIKDEEHICSNMSNPEVRILYLGPDQRHHGTMLIQGLEEQGYEVLNKVAPVLLRAKIRSLFMEGRGPVAVVTLRSSRGNERIVASFESMAECSHWFDEVYPGGLVTEIVSLDNQLLKDVRKVYG